MTEETLVSRIRRLTDAVRKARGGDFSFCVEANDKYDELDLLANEVRRMVESVQEHVVCRKAAEDARRDCEERYRRLKANIPGMVYIFAMHPDGTFSLPYVNDASRDLFDLSPENLMADASLLTRLIHPDDRERFASSVKISAEKLQPWREELRFIVNGEVRWHDCMSRPESQPDGDILWDGIVLEITERKLAEEALRQANLVVENSPVVLFRWRATEGWPVELVSRNVTQFGYEPEEFLSGAVPFSHMVHPQDLERVAADVQGHSERGDDQFEQEYRIVTRDGVVRWVDDRTVIGREASGQVTHYQGILIDITDRKRVEETLRGSEERFRSLVETTSDWIWEVDLRGVYTYASPKVKDILGYDPREIIGKTPFDLMPPEEAERIRLQFADIVESGKSFHDLENLNLHKSGQAVILETNGVPIVGTDGKLCGYRGIDRDITERKRAEAALQESEKIFRVLAETSPTAIFLYQGEMIIYANPATERLFGYTSDELLRMKFWDWAHVDFKEKVRDSGLARQKGETVPSRYESSFVTKDGEDRWLVVSAGLIEYHGKPAGVASFLDITESKRVEGQLRNSLAEKELLLKEVHHRVKNNLQIISTLLDLQADKFDNENLLKSIKESQDRIKAMALIHERLYQSSDLVRIDFWEYIESLVGHLLSSYVDDPLRIAMKVDVGDIQMGIDRAIPCGLIINELVSNAMKHAFPDGRGGEIAIRLHTDDSGHITLTVADDGVGMPAGMDFRKTESLGLQLVNMLTKQLRGQIDMSGDHGTLWVICFRSMDNG